MANSSEILVVIPARGGSKALKNKNLQLLRGKSLVARAVLAAHAIPYQKEICVSTDSSLIAIEAEKFGAKVPFIREDNLSTDLASTEDVLKDALIRCEKHFKKTFDLVIYFSPSEGYLASPTVTRGISFLNENKNYESYFPGKATAKNFWKLSSENKRFMRLSESMVKYSSRQEKEPIWREDTGRGLVGRSDLWREGRRIGNQVYIESTSDIRADLDIHTLDDLRFAEFVLSELGDHEYLK